MTEPKLSSAWRRVVEKNPLLKHLAPAGALLLLLVIWQELHDLRTSLQTRHADTRAQLARIEALRGQTVWEDRAIEASRNRETAEARITVARTPGLAEAALQNEMRSLLDAMGTTSPPRIDVEQAANEGLPEGIIQIRATVSAAMSATRTTELVARVERTPTMTRVEALDIRAGVRPGMQIVLSRYYRIRNDEGQP